MNHTSLVALVQSMHTGKPFVLAANDTPAMLAFMVTVGARAPFEAMGTSSMAVRDQHEGLCTEGEKIDVQSLAKWQEARQRKAVNAALEIMRPKFDSMNARWSEERLSGLEGDRA